MGFGLIFLGWIPLVFFRILPVGIIGCFVMSRGLSKLEGYSPCFKKALYACYVFLGYSLVYGVLWALEFAGIWDYTSYDVLQFADSLAYLLITAVFSYFLYKALGSISKQVGFDKGVRRERTSIVLLCINMGVMMCNIIFSPMGVDKYTALPVFIMELFRFLYTSVYIYSCYMMIATQEIIDEENKKMREYDEKHSFLNKKKK